MRKIILFYIGIYISVFKCYALPLLGVIPFVFDFSILGIIFILGLFNTFIFYIFKKIKVLHFLILIFNLFSLATLCYLFRSSSIFDININYIYISGKYIYLLLGISILIGILYNKKQYFISMILLLFTLGININLIYETKSLINFYNKQIDSLVMKGIDIGFTSDIIINNILVSRDLEYYYKGEYNECRITVSYYKHTNNLGAFAKNAPREDFIHLYTGLSKRTSEGKSECRILLESK